MFFVDAVNRGLTHPFPKLPKGTLQKTALELSSLKKQRTSKGGHNVGSLVNIAVKRDVLFRSSSLPLVVANWCFEARTIKIQISKSEIQPHNKKLPSLSGDSGQRARCLKP